MRFAPARRRGYAKRYLRHQLGQHGMELLLAAAFLLGVLLGCWMTSGENTRLVEQLNGLLSAQQGSFLIQVVSSFAAVAALLLILFLSGLGAVFQPLVPLVLFWRGMGFGALGVCSYAAGQSSNSLYYLLVLLPRALGEVLLLICAGGCALRFSSRFFYALFPKEISEQTPVRQTPQGGLLGYLLRYLIFYFLGGSVALLSSLLEFAFSLMGG